MATYWVRSGHGGTNSGTSANPYLTFAQAVAVASSDGDVILVHKAHSEVYTVSTTHTFLANLSVICVDMDASDALARMQDSTGIFDWRAAGGLAGARRIYFYGINIDSTTSSGTNVQFGATDNSNFTYDNCRIYRTQSNTGGVFSIGSATLNTSSLLIDCFVGAITSARFAFRGNVEMLGGEISYTNSLAGTYVINSVGVFNMHLRGVTATFTGSPDTLFGAAHNTNPGAITAHGCVFSAHAPILPAQGSLSNAHAEALLTECKFGSTLIAYQHANALGSTISDTGIYATDNPAAYSLKITTSSGVTRLNPYRPPFFEYYNESVSAITPRLECLREGDSTAFTDAELFGEFMAQTTSASPLLSLYDDAASPTAAGTAQATGMTGSGWAGAGGTHWSGKLELASSITPNSAGWLLYRPAFGASAATIYVDPKVRT